ncbi:MAG TPA: glycosyltransferase [Acidimicrobiales bacterium]|nr:glycosyltransferase [Acidimicrobiales bacterium]
MARHIDEPLNVLIVSATVGAGDAGNARELARRLSEQGHTATVVDFLQAPPLHIGQALSKSYEAELRHAPWAYELAFGIWYWFPFLLRPLSRFLSMWTRRAVRRWVAETQADVVVSTYPVATQVLGDMRRRARWPGPRRYMPWARDCALRVPAVNFITDFGYHPFWAHRGIDLNLAVHPATVASVARSTGRPSMACAPLVGPGFGHATPQREAQRARLGLAPAEHAVLISSGSWGVGTVRETVELLARQPGLVPVVVCGHNSRLQADLERVARARGYRAIILGWTDDMPAVMAACDALVENAGGLTSLEAMRAGLPLVSFRPIPGHGRKSAAAMAAAGVSSLARENRDLVRTLHELCARGARWEAQLAAAAQLFSADASRAVAQVGTWGAPPRPRLRPQARLARVAYTIALVGAMSWVGMTTGVGVAAAAGAGVAHPPPGQPDTIYVGARLDDQELVDPAVQQALLMTGASAIIDLHTAELEPGAVRHYSAVGIDIQSGGLGCPPGSPGAPAAPWAVAQSDSHSVQLLSAIAGEAVDGLVPDRSLSAFDLVDAGAHHLKMVVPETTLPLPPSGPYPRSLLALPALQGGHIYEVDGQLMSSDQLVAVLEDLRLQLASDGLALGPLGGLS